MTNVELAVENERDIVSWEVDDRHDIAFERNRRLRHPRGFDDTAGRFIESDQVELILTAFQQRS